MSGSSGDSSSSSSSFSSRSRSGLDADRIERFLGELAGSGSGDGGPRYAGRRLMVYESVSSTNTIAARAATSAEGAGLAVFAEEQTAGRGRRGRSWSAPRGSSILMSVVLAPPPALGEDGCLTALGAVAVAEALEGRLGSGCVDVKWPNDVRISGRKVAGVLVERPSGARGVAAVVGIGCNVTPEAGGPEALADGAGYAATSLARELGAGAVVDRCALAAELLWGLERWCRACEGGASVAEELMVAWRSRCGWIGRRARVRTSEGAALEGVLSDADPRRGVRLEGGDWVASGRIERLEVSGGD